MQVEYPGNDVDLWLADFDQVTTEYMQWTVAFPSDWDASVVTAVFYWTVTGGGAAQVVRWQLQGRSYGDSDAIDQAWGAVGIVDDTWIANDDVHITGDTGSITITGAGASELVQLRASADAANSDLGSDARLIGVMVTFSRT